MERNSFYKNIILITVVLMAVLFTGLPKDAFSQKLRSMEGEVGFYYNPTENGDNNAGYAQFLYTWWFNKYIGCSAGGMVLKAKQLFGNFYGGWTVGDKEYTFSNPVLHLNAIGEFRVAVPLVWKFGFALNARLMFEPVPVDVISYEIHQGDKVFPKSHYVFTRFNLSGIINAGLYFDYKKIRISLGYGRGSYDAYNSYRYASIDGHNLAEHVLSSNSRYIHNVFLSLTVFD